MKFDKKDLLLYGVTDRTWLGQDTLCAQVAKAIKGGATCIQLREKYLNQTEFLKEAKEIRNLCQTQGIPFFVNDNVEIAVAIDADGVHVGQSDMAAGNVRRKIGADKILGVSAQNVEQAIKAQEQGADYLGVGAVFPTGSKQDAVEVSHQTLEEICAAVSIPVIAIGGINPENTMELAGRGICGIAVIGSIFGQKDIEEATRTLKGITIEMVKK